MAVNKRVINGEKVWIIDRRFRRSDGQVERYRRVAQVQTRPAAEAEERRIQDHFAMHGTIAALVEPPKPSAKVGPVKVHTWDDAVEHYKANVMPQHKPSVRASYGAMLKQPILGYWKGRPLPEITRGELKKWETWAREAMPVNSTRLKHHIVLRSVLRSVGPDPEGDEPGLMLAELPKFIPLPKPEKKAIDVPHEEDVDLIMNEGRDKTPKYCRIRSIRRAQLAFALSLWAGLRAGEVRALRKGDIDERRRTVTVRRSRCEGEETLTKGLDERVIPIADLLWERLEPRLKELKHDDDHICVNLHGEPYGDFAIYQAFVRACSRLKIKGSRYHACRHYFATALFGGGADAVTVQHHMGHKDMTTTQRYAHYDDERGRQAVAVFSRVKAEAAE